MVIRSSCVMTFPCISPLYFTISRSTRCLPKNLVTRFSFSLLKLRITGFLSNTINDVIYYEAATRGLITSPEDELAVAAADVSRFRKISENSQSGFRSRDLHFSLNEDRCVPRTRKHISFLSHTREGCGELITP